MVIPNAEQIEGAVDNLQNMTKDQDAPYPAIGEWERTHQFKELAALPAVLPKRWGFDNGDNSGEADINTTDVRFQYGYFLGLQTARIVLAGSAALAMRGVDPKDVL